MNAAVIPDSVKACVWFADPAALDWEGNKALIITQVLNRGTQEAVRWVHERYGWDAVRDVVSHPRRGLWFPQALNFWIHFFGISLKPETYQRALFRLAPV